jgi:hypothetical protein
MNVPLPSSGWCEFQLLVTANIISRSLILFTLMMDEMYSSESSVLTRATRRHIPEDDTLHCQRSESPKSYEKNEFLLFICYIILNVSQLYYMKLFCHESAIGSKLTVHNKAKLPSACHTSYV